MRSLTSTSADGSFLAAFELLRVTLMENTRWFAALE
jgi:hypothetical protein